MNVNKQKIKIMHILSRLETGGLENGVVNICNKLNRDQFEPSICCLKGLGPMTKRIKSDVKVLYLNFPEGKSPLRVFKMTSFFKKEKPDIVHTHGWGQCSFDGIIGARLASVPTVINGEHGSFFLKGYQIFLQRRLAGLCDLTLSVSEALKKEIAKNLGITLNLISVIPNGVDTDIFNGRHDTEALKFQIAKGFKSDDNASFLIASIGSLKNQKNQIFLLRAIKEINARNPDNNIKVIIVGDGPDRRILEQYAADNLKKGQAVFLGQRSDIPVVLSLSKLLVSTSLGRYEGLSNVILEAMASGVPVIATRSIGTSELITDGLNGFIIDTQSSEALGKKIESLTQNNFLQEKISKNAKESVYSKYSIEKMLTSYEETYLRIFSGRDAKNKWLNL